jgi:RNA polymerase-binding transcription factor DksA
MAKKVVKKAKKATKKVASKKVAPKKAVKKTKPVAKAKPAAKPKKVKKVEAKKKPVAKAVKVVAKKPAPIKAIVKKEIKKAAPVVKAVKAAPVKVSKEDAKNRYTEKELVEFRKIILDKLDQAKIDYDLLKNTLCHTDDHGTDDTSPTFKMLEDGSDVLTREETAQLALRQEKFIQNLQNALIRIENKTYGICRVTGKLIPKERLKRVPHATLSIDAKLEQQYRA